MRNATCTRTEASKLQTKVALLYGSLFCASDFGLQTLVSSFANTVIANIAFAKLPNISGTYSVKAIQTKVKNGKNDLDCKCRLLEYDVIYSYFN
jgi:hypothetical protein